jgi:hypothetical protein
MAISRRCPQVRALKGMGIVEAVGPGGAKSDGWNSRSLRGHVERRARADRVPGRQTRAHSRRSGRSSRRHFLHQSFDGMGLDQISSQSQGGRLASAASAASSVGKFVLQLAQHYRFKTINVIRRREQESIIRNLGGNEVIRAADEDLRARLQNGCSDSCLGPSARAFWKRRL